MFRSSLLLLLALAVSGRAVDPDELQARADRVIWEWSDEKANVLDSMLHASCDYEIGLLRKKGGWGEMTIRFADKDGDALAIAGHLGTTFVTDGGVVYYSEYSLMSSGCSLIAYDLKARKRLWSTPLRGLGPINHTKYHNRVRVELLPGVAVRVWGKESSGNYLEYVDLKTGKTVAHRLFERAK
jgi:hypothetical protein